MKVKAVVANPSGNRTLMVTTPVSGDMRAGLAKAAMELRPEIEQVGFVTEPRFGGRGRLEMAGGEFCGNGARAFAYHLAKRDKLRLPADFEIEISGCDEPLRAFVGEGCVRLRFPGPALVEALSTESESFKVELPGITHLVLHSKPDEALAAKLIEDFKRDEGGAALGLMFLEEDRLTPLVWVRQTGTLIWESSCGSGTVACAAVESARQGRPVELRLEQPGGALGAGAGFEDGDFSGYLFGTIELEEERELDLKL